VTAVLLRLIPSPEEKMKKDAWKGYFENFSFPYGFYSPEEYEPWLQEGGFVPHGCLTFIVSQ